MADCLGGCAVCGSVESFHWWQRWDSSIVNRHSWAVASIPEFSGGSSVHEWIQRARKVAEANGWSDLKLLSVLPAFLAGKALIEYNSIMEKKKQFSSLDGLGAELQQALSQYEDPLDEFFETRLRWTNR